MKEKIAVIDWAMMTVKGKGSLVADCCLCCA